MIVSNRLDKEKKGKQTSGNTVIVGGTKHVVTEESTEPRGKKENLWWGGKGQSKPMVK